MQKSKEAFLRWTFSVEYNIFTVERGINVRSGLAVYHHMQIWVSKVLRIAYPSCVRKARLLRIVETRDIDAKQAMTS